MPNFDIRKYPQARLITPLISLGILTYCSWAYIDRFCVRQLLRGHYYKHSRAVAIVLISLYSTLTAILLLVWSQVLLIGPGRQPRIPAYQLLDIPTSEELSIPPPPIYQCDPNGYPIWCPVCNSVKALRSHHSSMTGHCVPRFDHYCSWLGSVIGRANYRLFMQFLLYNLMSCIVVIVTVVVYYLRMWSQTGRTKDGNLIALIVLAGFVFLFVLSLLVTHLYYIGKNQTSLEVMIVKASNKRRKNKGFSHQVRSGVFVCFRDNDVQERYVIEISKGDFNKFWNKGTRWANFRDMLGQNVLTWFLPLFNSESSGVRQNDVEREEDRFSKEGAEGSESFLSTQRDILGPLYEEINEESTQRLKLMIKQGNYVRKVDVYADRVTG